MIRALPSRLRTWGLGLARIFSTPDGRPTSLALFLAAFAWVCLSLWLAHPTYVENDDLTILDFAVRGVDVPYAGVLFTRLLHILYVLAPHQPWYGLALYAVHVLALCLWFALLWRALHPAWLAAIGCLSFCVAYMVFLFSLNYTSTSVMLCVAALSGLCLDLMEGRRGWRRYLGLGLAFTLGAWLRPQGALGALVYALPLLLLAALAAPCDERSRIDVRRLALAGLVFCAPIFVNFTIDAALRAYMETPEYQAYDAFNAPRGRLQRLSRPAKRLIMDDAPLLASIHWKRNDAIAFFNWNFVDERVFTAEALDTLLAGAPRARPDRAWVDETLLKHIRMQRFLFLLLAGCLPLFAVSLLRHPGLALLGLAAPVYCVGLTSYMYVFYSYTHRVELPYETGFAFASLAVAAALALRAGPVQRQLRLLGGAAALLVMLYACWQLVRIELMNHHGVAAGHKALLREIKFLNQDYAGSIILMQPKSGLPLEKSNPLQSVRLRFTPIQLGWSTFSPRFYQQIAPLGIQHGYQLVEALATHPNAYVICAPGWCRTLLNHAGGGYTLEPLRRMRGRLSLCRVRRKAPVVSH